jgi:cytochrome c
MQRGIRLAALWLIAFVGLSIGLDGPGAQTDDDTAAVTIEIPYEAKYRNNLREATPESIDNGKLIYSSQCTMCHGQSGDGKGDLASRLGYEMPDFTSAEVQKARTDGEWFYILSEGHGKMSGESERIRVNVRWDLVNYIRTLSPAEGD